MRSRIVPAGLVVLVGVLAVACGGSVPSPVTESGAATVPQGSRPPASTRLTLPGTTAIDGAGSPTTAASPADWTMCRTVLDYQLVLQDVGGPSPASRQAALDLLHGMSAPPGHDDVWPDVVKLFERVAEVAGAASSNPNDRLAHDSTVGSLVASDPDAAPLMRKIEREYRDALTTIVPDAPCDPVGIPDSFGCESPEACTDAWIAAAVGGDAAALAGLGSVGLRPSSSPVQGPLARGACTKSGSHPGVVRCDARGGFSEAHIDWAPMKGDRWFGVSLSLQRFVSVGSVIQ